MPSTLASPQVLMIFNHGLVNMRSIYLLTTASLIALTTSCARDCCQDCVVVDETYVHKYGVAVPSNFWDESGKDGSVVSSMADGVVITRSYSQGLLNGNTTYSFPHSSQIEKIEVYNQGTLISTTEYYVDGTRKSEVSFDTPLGMKTISTWYLSGIPRSVETFAGDNLVTAEYFSPTNQRDAFVQNSAGTRLIRDDYGHLLATDTISKGQIKLRTAYHPNGSPKEQVQYKDGLVDGTKKTFHPAGEPATVETWAAGTQQGTTTLYQHGEKYADVPYLNGQKNGTEVRYRDGSTVVQEINWSQDEQHGPTTTYIGDNTKTDWYFRGAPTTKADYDFLVSKPIAR